MKKSAIKAISLLICLNLFLGGCTGGGGAGNKDDDLKKLDAFETITDAQTPSWEQDKSEFTFEWFLNVPWMVWPTNGHDMVSAKIKELTGATIKIRAASTEDNTELSTMISSGQFPDVISVQASYTQTSQLADQGYIWAIDDLMERFAPSMKPRFLEQQKDVHDWFMRGDGKMYGLPNISYPNIYKEGMDIAPNGGFLVREDWYNEVAAQGIDMTSPDGLIAGCKYIAGKYKNAIPIQLDQFTQNGNHSLIWLAQYFAVPFETRDGEYNYTLTDPKYAECIQFINRCTREKLIDTTNFSANRDAITRNMASKNVFVSMVTPQDYLNPLISCYNSGVTYIPLVLRNSAGDDPVLQDLSGKGYLLSMITKQAERPDKIIKVFDFLTSDEGQLLTQYGVEGETWNWEDESKTRIKWTDSYLEKYNNDDIGSFGLKYCNMLINQAFVEKVAPRGTAGKKDSDIYVNNLKKPLCPYSYDYSPSFLIHDTSDSEYFSYLQKNDIITKLWARYLPDILRASSEEEAIKKYNETIEEMKSRGLDDVIAFNARSYQTAKKAAGVTVAWPPYRENYQSPTAKDGSKIGPNGDFSYWEDAEHTNG